MVAAMAILAVVALGCSPVASQPSGMQSTDGDSDGPVDTTEAAPGTTEEGTTIGPTPPERETEDGSSTGSASESCGLPELESLLTAVGPSRVETASLTFVDTSRATPAPDGSEPLDARSLPTTFWLPASGTEPGPLVLFAHGFGSTAADGAALAERWASFGYVVAAPDFPATSTGVAGGPLAADVVEQPADLAFLITAITEASRDPRSPLSGRVDATRVGVAGLSLGALTTLLMLDGSEVDIDSALLLATPSCFLPSGLAATSRVPTLALHGDSDVVTPFDEHATPLLRPRSSSRWVVRIDGGTHTGFSTLAQSAAAGFEHADMLGCEFLTAYPELWEELSAAVDGETTRCAPICGSAPPWPAATSASVQLDVTAALSLIHFGRTLRGCEDAEVLWELLIDGAAAGVEVL